MTTPAVKLPVAIDTLCAEHRYMNLLLGTLEEQLASSDFTKKGDFYLVQDIVHYMHEYPDVAHHPTEDLMFNTLVKRKPGTKTSVARLRREHQLLRENTEEILRLLGVAARRRSPKATKAVRDATANYISRLREHMQFEEADLFPSAIQCLASKDWHEIELRLEAKDDPLFGPTVEGDYRVLYEYFAGRAAQLSRQVARFDYLQLDNLILSADAVETGIREMWDLLHERADFVVQEFRTVSEKAADGSGLSASLAAQFGYAGIIGKTTVEVGAKAAGIYLRTCRKAAMSLIRGAG